MGPRRIEGAPLPQCHKVDSQVDDSIAELPIVLRTPPKTRYRGIAKTAAVLQELQNDLSRTSYPVGIDHDKDGRDHDFPTIPAVLVMIKSDKKHRKGSA